VYECVYECVCACLCICVCVFPPDLHNRITYARTHPQSPPSTHPHLATAPSCSRLQMWSIIFEVIFKHSCLQSQINTQFFCILCTLKIEIFSKKSQRCSSVACQYHNNQFFCGYTLNPPTPPPLIPSNHPPYVSE